MIVPFVPGVHARGNAINGNGCGAVTWATSLSFTHPRPKLSNHSYRGFETDVTQAHIHFGARATTGGISVWLCKTTQTGPGADDAQTCPARAGTIEGTIEPADVVGPAGQGITTGEWEEFIDALRAGVTYANVHSTARPPGEIRAQLNEDDDHGRW